MTNRICDETETVFEQGDSFYGQTVQFTRRDVKYKTGTNYDENHCSFFTNSLRSGGIELAAALTQACFDQPAIAQTDELQARITASWENYQNEIRTANIAGTGFRRGGDWPTDFSPARVHFPKCVVSASFRDNKLHAMSVYEINNIELNMPVPDSLFQLSRNVGDKIFDYRPSRDRPRYRKLTEFLPNVAQIRFDR